MPVYQFSCPACDSKFDVRLTFSAYTEVKEGRAEENCRSCTHKLDLDFAPGNLGMVMKEGPSGGWESKSAKERKYRDTRYSTLGKRQKDNHFVSKLQPNYKGEETGTWRGAQEEARKDKGDAAAAQYTPLVAEEKKA